MLPTGSIILFAAEAAPSGFLICQGQSVPISDYGDLFNSIGHRYAEVPAPSGFFTLPDMRGRVPAGLDPANVTGRLSTPFGADALGNAGGSQNITLLTSQLPIHNHGIDSPSGSAGVQSGGDFSVSTDFSSSGTTTGGAGDNHAHLNVQPTIILNYIIKT